jgi:hypothetical protein
VIPLTKSKQHLLSTLTASEVYCLLATEAPLNESEVNWFYLEGPLSIYENLPLQKATMTSGMTHATVSLQGIVDSFLVLGN